MKRENTNKQKNTPKSWLAFVLLTLLSYALTNPSPLQGAATEVATFHPLVATSPALEEQPLRIGILGYGTFGKFLGSWFSKANHQIYGWEIKNGDPHVSLENENVCFYENYEEMAQSLAGTKLDVLIIAVSIISFQKIVAHLPMHTLENVLLVDVLSVKEHAKDILTTKFGSDIDMLFTHPMFGPNSGRVSWNGLSFVFDQSQVSDKTKLAHFLQIFENFGCVMVPMTCEDHDKIASRTQFVAHLTARILAQQQINRLDSGMEHSSFRQLCDFMDVTTGSDDLFRGLYKYNKHSKEWLGKFQRAFGVTDAKINLILHAIKSVNIPKKSPVLFKERNRFITLFIAKVLNNLELSRSQIDTKGFQILMKIREAEMMNGESELIQLAIEHPEQCKIELAKLRQGLAKVISVLQ